MFARFYSNFVNINIFLKIILYEVIKKKVFSNILMKHNIYSKELQRNQEG